MLKTFISNGKSQENRYTFKKIYMQLRSYYKDHCCCCCCRWELLLDALQEGDGGRGPLGVAAVVGAGHVVVPCEHTAHKSVSRIFHNHPPPDTRRNVKLKGESPPRSAFRLSPAAQQFPGVCLSRLSFHVPRCEFPFPHPHASATCLCRDSKMSRHSPEAPCGNTQKLLHHFRRRVRSM